MLCEFINDACPRCGKVNKYPGEKYFTECGKFPAKPREEQARSKEDQATLLEICRGCVYIISEPEGEYCGVCRGCRTSKQEHFRYLLRRGKCPSGIW